LARVESTRKVARLVAKGAGHLLLLLDVTVVGDEMMFLSEVVH